jgi:hypothetical protein
MPLYHVYMATNTTNAAQLTTANKLMPGQVFKLYSQFINVAEAHVVRVLGDGKFMAVTYFANGVQNTVRLPRGTVVTLLAK